MVRLAIRVLITPISIALIDILILATIVLTVVAVGIDLFAGKFNEPLGMIERIGVVLIAWGVTLEERGSLREIFHTADPSRETVEQAIDAMCHSSGVGLVILGLFSEIGMAAIGLPDNITPGEAFDRAVLAVSTILVALGALVLFQHLMHFVLMIATGRVPSSTDR